MLYSIDFQSQQLSSANNTISTKKMHRVIYKSFIANFQESKRIDFWKIHPKSCKWLNTYDINWFEKTFPPPT